MLEFLVISYTLFALGLVLVLLSKKGMQEDNNLKRKKAIGKEAVKVDYKNVDTSFYERVVKPFVDKITKADKYGSNATKSIKKKKQMDLLALKLRKAGIHMSASNFQFFKTAFMLIVVVISIGLGAILFAYTDYALFIMLGGMIIGVIGPDMYLNSKVKSHQQAIKNQLAETIDLMGVCMESGLSFDAALVKVSERMEGPFIDELMTAFKQIQLGKNRNDALKAMADSTDVKQIKTFVSAVIQANQLGIPITNVLSAQAEQLRLDKSEEIKEMAAKVPTKMTLPTVIFILPAIMIVILAPVMFSVIDNLSGVF